MFRNGKMQYEETSQCGNQIGQYVHQLANIRESAKPFSTDGRIDLKKTVDITNLKAGKKEQNKSTTYTVENLKNLLEQGNIDSLRDCLYNAESGYYGEEADESTIDESAEYTDIPEKIWMDIHRDSGICIGTEVSMKASCRSQANIWRIMPESIRMTYH